ncbi:hypothetical protein [Candidatus Kuenenia sp.]|uniref:hypothetical protein n=1 Tax=Candidatus Kuenenia sp. TaxID=2499824 RepID=UPI003AF40BEA
MLRETQRFNGAAGLRLERADKKGTGIDGRFNTTIKKLAGGCEIAGLGAYE